MRQEWRAHIFLFITSLIQGFNFSLAKVVMPDYVKPGAIIIIRGLAAVLFFWIISSCFIKERVESRKDYFMIFLCSLFGVALNQLLFYKGLSLTKPINASLMVTVSPVAVLVLSVFAGDEKVNWLKITGIVFGATGVILLLLNSSKKGPESLFVGDILILINATSYGAFLVLVKPLMRKYHAFTILKWMFLFGIFMVTPFGWEGFLAVDWVGMPLNPLLALLFVVIFATFITYSLNVAVMKTVNPSLAGIYIYIQPLMAAIIAVLLGKDTLTLPKTIFSIMIIGGVFLVSKGEKVKSSELKA
jgi:drug/metabolite transporter (DMT)-like permease